MGIGDIMIKLGYEEIISRIEENSDLQREDIEAKIKTKLKQLDGLISKEGAAHIVANQLGIKLVEKISGRLQIKNILSGMRDVETVGKIVRMYPVRHFNVNGREGKVANLVIGDETAAIRLVLWGDHADVVSNAQQGMVLKVISGYVKENNGNKELHLGTRGSLALNPRGEKIESVQAPVSKRKRIEELKDGMSDVEVLGTVVQLFDPRFYEVCPSCNKRIFLKDDRYVCDTHGEQEPKHGYVLNLVLDDGTATIRSVFFRQSVLDLLKKDEPAMKKYKESPELFEEIKQEMLGQVIKVNGRVVSNKMFDRPEIVASYVDPKPDPDEIIKHLDKELAKQAKTQEKPLVAEAVHSIDDTEFIE